MRISGGWLRVLRWLAAVGFCLAGVNHFREPDFYCRIIPPGSPHPFALVVISGLCEIAGGVGLLIGALRRVAGWGLIALLIAVFPANVYMAVEADKFADFPRAVLWIRLPLQAVFVLWVWLVSRVGDGRFSTQNPVR